MRVKFKPVFVILRLPPSGDSAAINFISKFTGQLSELQRRRVLI